jgi:hypothetical protein
MDEFIARDVRIRIDVVGLLSDVDACIKKHGEDSLERIGRRPNIFEFLLDLPDEKEPALATASDKHIN